jgi:methionyl-tRNA synthetase
MVMRREEDATLACAVGKLGPQLRTPRFPFWERELDLKTERSSRPHLPAMRTRLRPTRNALTPLQSLILRRWRPPWVCHSCQRRQQLSYTTSATPGDALAEKPYYATTPIFYVNAAPHVGHMYTLLLADVLKRWQVFKNRPAILCTGTDEHGLKVQQAAAKAGVRPQEFCDAGAEVFRSLAERIGVSNDIFIRTTHQKHKDGVEYAWQMLERKGHIYESKHEGWYSVSDETFYPQAQVQLIVEPATGRKLMVSVETGKEVEWTSERNYHFRLSAFKDKLLEFYQQNPNFIVPKPRMEEVVNEVRAGLSDLSVSRPVSRLTWGIRVPTDPTQTIYVWLDALLNYATATGYPNLPPESAHALGFPADVHVIGKDIVRFHAIYWPAFLMALEVPLPRQLLVHAHWTLGKQKMSKSTGNVVNPFFALERFGLDSMRWYLILSGGITDDADYDNSFIAEKYRKGLQGGLGNLASRVMRGRSWDVRRAVERYAHPDFIFEQNEGEEKVYPAVSQESDRVGRRVYGNLRAIPAQVDSSMQDLHPNRALQRIMGSVSDMNAYLQHAAPWAISTRLQSIANDSSGNQLHDLMQAGSSPEALEAELDRVIFLAAECLRLSGLLLQPFIPGKAGQLLDLLGVEKDRRGWEWAVVGKDERYGKPLHAEADKKEGLFPRLASGD